MEKTYLVVPYAEKDEAKRLGARWDPQAKSWYITADRDQSPFKAWLPKAATRSAGEKIESSSAYVATTIAKCWKCRDVMDVICIYCASATVNGRHNTHINCYNIAAMDPALTEQMKPYTRFRFAFSRKANGHYFANHCRWCDALQGDFYDHNEIGGAFYPEHRDDYGLFGFQPLAGTVRFEGLAGSGVMSRIFSLRGSQTHPDIWDKFCEAVARREKAR